MLLEGWTLSVLPRGRFRKRVLAGVDRALRRVHVAGGHGETVEARNVGDADDSFRPG